MKWQIVVEFYSGSTTDRRVLGDAEGLRIVYVGDRQVAIEKEGEAIAYFGNVYFIVKEQVNDN